MNTFLACIAGIIGVVEGEQGEKRRPDVVPPFTFIKHFVAGLEIKKKIQPPFCDWLRKSSRKFTNFNRKTN